MEQPKPQPKNALGVAGLTLSIVGWLTCGLLCPFGVLLSLFGLAKQPKRAAVAGIIVGGLGSFLLAAMIVIGIVYLDYSRLSGHARSMAAQSQLNMLRTPLALYQMDVGSYPTTSQGLTALRQPPSDLDDPTKWNGPYLSEPVPSDPWSGKYHYELLNPDQYSIHSAGPDGISGSFDDIVVSEAN